MTGLLVDSTPAVDETECTRQRPSLAARVLIRMIDGYQFFSSRRPTPCRFVPDCSHYSGEAIQVHGARRGLALTLRRLSRCHPWGPSGPDPVPRRKG